MPIKAKIKAKAKIFVKIDIDYLDKLPVVIDFLILISKSVSKQFDIIQLRNFHNCLKRSGDRYLRELHENGLIEYSVDKSRGIYTLKSDIFDLQILKNRVEAGGYWIEPDEPIFIPKNKRVQVNQLSLIL